MDGRVIWFGILLDFVAALRRDGDFALGFLFGNCAARLAAAPVPRD